MEDARTVNIFGKDIDVRKYGCKNHCMQEPLYITIPRVNLFIQTTSLCNANCPFCIYHNNERRYFNFDKLEIILKELSSRKDFDLNKLNFTGGEPTLPSVNLDRIIEVCRNNIDYSRKPEVTLNTNGYDLEFIVKHQDFLDSVGLSRHHYNDGFNQDIFKTNKVPNSNDISNLMNCLENKLLIQLRCNLINGYIDSYDEMINYLEHAIDLGVYDCGFVTLTPNNDYCRKHQIDFANLVRINENLIKTNGWQRLDENNNVYCECANYMYSNKQGKFCKFYSRLFCHNENKESILVYDGQNLRFGFGGEIIL